MQANANLLYAFGHFDRYIRPPQPPQLDLMEGKTSRQLFAINLAMSEHGVLLSTIFRKFQTGINKGPVKDTFHQQKNIWNSISLTEVWALFTHFDVHNLVSKKEVKQLVKQLSKEKASYGKVSNLTYAGFKQFMYESAVLVYSKRG